MTTAEADTMSKRKLCPKAKAGHAASKKPVTTAPTPWDLGAKGKANQRDLVIEDAAEVTPEGRSVNPNGVRRARRVDMLERWHRLGKITTGGYNAAEKLRNAFEATERAPGWPDNDRVQSSPKPDHAVTIQIDRLSKFHEVYKFIPTGDRRVINHCVLSQGTPAGLREFRGRNHEKGMAHLREALDRLAKAMGA